MANEEHLARLKQGVEAWNRCERHIPKLGLTSFGTSRRGGPL